MPEIAVDRRAWVRGLLDRWEGPLVRYAQGLTGRVESARDVVQETFLRLCAQEPAKLQGREVEWLFTVCRNLCVDEKRKEGRMTEVDQLELDARESKEPPPGRAVETRDQTSRVLALVSGLPKREQELVRLKFQEGLSYREIAKVTKLTESNVGYLLHTALKTLRTRLQAPGLAAQA